MAQRYSPFCWSFFITHLTNTTSLQTLNNRIATVASSNLYWVYGRVNLSAVWRGRQQRCWFMHSIAILITFLPHHVRHVRFTLQPTYHVKIIYKLYIQRFSTHNTLTSIQHNTMQYKISVLFKTNRGENLLNSHVDKIHMHSVWCKFIHWM